MEQTDKLAFWHQLSSAKHLGPIRFRALWQALGDRFYQAFELSDAELQSVKGITRQAIDGIRAQADKLDESLKFMIDQQALASTAGGHILTLDDHRYPRYLYASKMSHAIIYCLGRVEDFIDYSRSLAIVGTRGPAKQSSQLARFTAEKLANKGWVIVSGLAKGIDSAAHEGALAASGRTIAVLGSGPDIVYPKEAKDLFCRIREKGLLVSEFPFGTRVSSLQLKKRNKTTVALSHATFVVESSVEGGAMNAVKGCEEQAKPLFTVLPPWQCEKSGNEMIAQCDGIVVTPGTLPSERASDEICREIYETIQWQVEQLSEPSL